MTPYACVYVDPAVMRTLQQNLQYRLAVQLESLLRFGDHQSHAKCFHEA